MKRIFIAVIALTFGLIVSCDRVDVIYPDLPSTELDYSLYADAPGDSAAYANNAWPTFSANTNTDRNILIEDFTGHRCIFCPPAADEAETIKSNNPGRVFVAAVHSGPDAFDANDAATWGGIAAGDFQTIVPPTYTHNFANAEGLQIGSHMGPFGFSATSQFFGNPRGSISRIESGGQHTQTVSNWQGIVNSALTANDLKVNIQAGSNYYPSTSGLFLHTEIEIIDPSLTNDLYTVVYLIEDSIVRPQKFPSMDSLTYVHHEVMRGCLDGRPFGQKLDAAHLDANGKYYFNYSVALPDGPWNTTDGHLYNMTNMHLLIYVRDAVTEEIYQVIEEHIQ